MTTKDILEYSVRKIAAYSRDEDCTSTEAMQLSQAVLNLTNALATIDNIEVRQENGKPYKEP